MNHGSTWPGEPAFESDFSPRKLLIAFVVLLGTLFGSSILPFSAVGLVMIPMTSEFGWGRTEFAGGVTVLMWSGALSAPFIGRYVDRMGVRPMIIGGTAVVALITMSMALQTRHILHFYLYFALLGVFGSTALGYSKVIGALFVHNRGKALAIFGVESSLAMAAAPILIQYLLDHFGWRGLFLCLGLIIMAMVPALWLILPEPGTDRAGTPAPHAAPQITGMEGREVFRSPTFWIVTLAGLVATAPITGLLPHYVPYLISRGFSAGDAVSIISVTTLFMAGGTLLGGFALDKVQTAKVVTPFGLISALGLGLMALVSVHFGNKALLFAAAGLLGFAGGAQRPMATYLQLRFFGLRAFAEVTGLQGAFLAVGMGIAPLAVGLSYDLTGSYQPALFIMTAMVALAACAYLLLGPYRYAAPGEGNTTGGN